MSYLISEMNLIDWNKISICANRVLQDWLLKDQSERTENEAFWSATIDTSEYNHM